METRANYVLIGAFTLAGFLGLLLFFMWFARFELNRQFAYYDIRFETVSGLAAAGTVRFSGLPVGQVVSMGLDPSGDGRVRVRIEVAAGTPVRVDSIATLESQGVTGVSYIAITPGSPDAPLLYDATDEVVPLIRAGRSVFQTLTEDAPDLIAEAVEVIRQVGDLLGQENQQRVANILSNLEQSSGALEQALDDFSGIAGSISSATGDIADFTSNLSEIAEVATTTLRTADTALEAFTRFAGRAEDTLDAGTGALEAAEGAFTEGQRLMQNDLQILIANLSEAAATVRGEIALLSSDARGTLAQFSDAGAAATARLNQAEATLNAANETISALNRTLETVDGAAARFDTLLADEGTALLSEARDAIAGANTLMDNLGRMAETDLPLILSDVRATSETARQAITDLSADLSGFTGRLDGLADDASEAFTVATETFANANETLVAIETAMAAAEETLATADQAFSSADRVINDEVGAIAADLRATLARIDAAVAQVADDIPAATADLRAMLARASSTIDEVSGVIVTSGGSIQTFAATGLPQFSRLAEEARGLVRTLERLTSQIERDPARFFLGRQTPEFRR
ncbi:MlaD family protein [Plastorhodobacter daqingensis]|uniref:MlaD family protein n=1 Tax=Plastorhodobacter daqingensis TaxID=1387281 RepID=A0ABW2UGK1_9RHOB